MILRYSSGRPLQEEALPKMLEKQFLTLVLPKATFHCQRHSNITYKSILTSGNIKAEQDNSSHTQVETIPNSMEPSSLLRKRVCSEFLKRVF